MNLINRREMLGHILCLLIMVAAGAAEDHAQQLVTFLRKQNAEHIRPVKDDASTIVVDMALGPTKLSLDEENQEFRFEGWTLMTWKDEYLTWDKKNYGGIDHISMDVEEIWTPDVSSYNRVGDISRSSFGKVPVVVHDSGIVLWFPPTNIKTACSQNLYEWPMDRHNCSLHMASWTHHGQQLNLRTPDFSPDVILDNYERSLEWKLEGQSGRRRNESLEGLHHIDLVFSFLLERKGNSAAKHIVAISLVIMMLIVSSYLLPIKNFLARIILHLFGIGVSVGSSMVLQDMIPHTTNKTPYIVYKYGITTTLSAISLLCTIALHYAVEWCNAELPTTSDEEPLTDQNTLTEVSIGAAPTPIGSVYKTTTGLSFLEDAMHQSNRKLFQRRINVASWAVPCVFTFSYMLNYCIMISYV